MQLSCASLILRGHQTLSHFPLFPAAPPNTNITYTHSTLWVEKLGSLYWRLRALWQALSGLLCFYCAFSDSRLVGEPPSPHCNPYSLFENEGVLFIAAGEQSQAESLHQATFPWNQAGWGNMKRAFFVSWNTEIDFIVFLTTEEKWQLDILLVYRTENNSFLVRGYDIFFQNICLFLKKSGSCISVLN